MPDPELACTRYFAASPDPRVGRAKKHGLSDILGVTPCAVICGAGSFEETGRFGDARADGPKRYFPLQHGIPGHDTCGRVLAALDRRTFAACFGRWMADPNTATGLEPIATDGKACRASSGDAFSGCSHPVSAWATEDGLILGPEAVADGGHEVTTTPVLPRALDLNGAVVTSDAAGCQKAVAEQVRARGGGYRVTVKGNHGNLHRAVGAAFEKAGGAEWAGRDLSASVAGGHGRHEERYATVVRDPGGLPPGWTDVGAVAVAGRERAAKGRNASTWHYHLTRLRGTAAGLGGYVRGHRGVGNGLHWRLDIAVREDENRTRDTNAGATRGVVRRVAASLPEPDTTRGGIKAKRPNAAWDQDYLKQVLQGFKAN